MRKSPVKLPVKREKGIKEASATSESTQAPVPLIPERRTKSALEGRQDVPRPGVGDEAEAGANNNQGTGKQKGKTSGAVRSPKQRVQPVAKNKDTAIPSKVPPTEIKKAEKKQDVGKGREKVVHVGSQKPHEDIPAQKAQVVSNKGKEKVVSVGSQKPHEDILIEKTQGVEKGKETAGSSEDPHMEKKKGKKKPGSKKAKGKGSLVKPTEKVQVPKEVKKPKRKDASAAPNLSKASEQPMKRKLSLQSATEGSLSKRVKVKSSALSLDSLLPPKPYLGRLVRMCRVDPTCPSRNTKMEKQTRMMDHLRKQHGLNVAIRTRVDGRVGGVSLNLVPKSSMRDQIRTQEHFQEVDRKYKVNRKAVERRAVIKALECWDCINKRHVRCSKDDFVQNFVASRMRKADAMQELKKDAIIRKI
ncbi:hypothetical protein L7F22_007560 [Adiantum nelumboides]|nr:hypothetical protein [Adiantum nelumboides]